MTVDERPGECSHCSESERDLVLLVAQLPGFENHNRAEQLAL